MVLVSIFSALLFILAFSPSNGGPGAINLEELCARCNGTLEIREGNVPHCIVTTDNDMEAAQRASAEAYAQGLTMVPELKVPSSVLAQSEGPVDGDEQVVVPEMLTPLNERTAIDGKELEMQRVPENVEENRVDDFDLMTAAANLDGAIFYDVSHPKDAITQNEPELPLGNKLPLLFQNTLT